MTAEEPLHSLFNLRGKVALITGGSRGLGLQVAEALGEFGAKLVLVARKEAELAATAADLQRKGIEALYRAGDLSSEGDIAALVDWLGSTVDSVDILVNNAGATWGASTTEHPLSAWQKLLAVNLTGPFLLTQAVAKRWMIPAGKGRIINIASIAGLLGNDPGVTGTIAYNTTKGGMVNFTRALASEWGRNGITVNAIAPGFFRSKMTDAFLDHNEAGIIERTPRGQLGGPHDIKGAALLFASDAGAHITGQILPIDGGLTAI